MLYDKVPDSMFDDVTSSESRLDDDEDEPLENLLSQDNTRHVRHKKSAIKKC